MTTITIKPVGADGPELTGKLTSEDSRQWRIRLSPRVASNAFEKAQWEQVLPPFVFPTIPGAVIEFATTSGGGRKYLFARTSDGWRRTETGAHFSIEELEELEGLHGGKFRVVFPGEGAEQ